jgi:hypothetical protein
MKSNYLVTITVRGEVWVWETPSWPDWAPTTLQKAIEDDTKLAGNPRLKHMVRAAAVLWEPTVMRGKMPNARNAIVIETPLQVSFKIEYIAIPTWNELALYVWEDLGVFALAIGAAHARELITAKVPGGSLLGLEKEPTRHCFAQGFYVYPYTGCTPKIG